MQVQGINNQNNISYKAYFKPNAEFKYLWAVRPVELNTIKGKLIKFKSDLPNQELEIINKEFLYGENNDSKLIYTIFNNATKKAKDIAIAISSTKNVFETIIEDLLDKNKNNDYFFKSDAVNISEYNSITKPRNENNR